jgi:hypothetical protein
MIAQTRQVATMPWGFLPALITQKSCNFSPSDAHEEDCAPDSTKCSERHKPILQKISTHAWRAHKEGRMCTANLDLDPDGGVPGDSYVHK